MREIVLDTETTGLDWINGDRVVELACLELVNHVPTGRHRQYYLNPQRAMPAEAEAVHGLGDAFLADKPLFTAVVDDFLDFIAEAPFVIHNAAFDLGFLNMELGRLNRPPLPPERATDTVLIARRRFPGAPASLDALCKRFDIDLARRTRHGALLDCELLAAVYLELIGGRQQGLTLTAQPVARPGPVIADGTAPLPRPPRPHAPTAEELTAHQALIATLKEAIWTRD